MRATDFKSVNQALARYARPGSAGSQLHGRLRAVNDAAAVRSSMTQDELVVIKGHLAAIGLETVQKDLAEFDRTSQDPNSAVEQLKETRDMLGDSSMWVRPNEEEIMDANHKITKKRTSGYKVTRNSKARQATAAKMGQRQRQRRERVGQELLRQPPQPNQGEQVDVVLQRQRQVDQSERSWRELKMNDPIQKQPDHVGQPPGSRYYPSLPDMSPTKQSQIVPTRQSSASDVDHFYGHSSWIAPNNAYSDGMMLGPSFPAVTGSQDYGPQQYTRIATHAGPSQAMPYPYDDAYETQAWVSQTAQYQQQPRPGSRAHSRPGPRTQSGSASRHSSRPRSSRSNGPNL